MKKLLAAIVAGMFAVTATAPVFAAEKKDEKKPMKAEKKAKTEKKKATTEKKAKPAKKADKKKKDEKK